MVRGSASPLTAEKISLNDKETLTKANIDCRSKMGWDQEKAERWKAFGYGTPSGFYKLSQLLINNHARFSYRN